MAASLEYANPTNRNFAIILKTWKQNPYILPGLLPNEANEPQKQAELGIPHNPRDFAEK